MPTVRTEDGREWRFPDGMSESQMADAIDAEISRENRPSPPQSGYTGDLSVDAPRFLGTAAVQGAAGMMSLPRLAAQGVDWLGSKVGLDVGADQGLGGIKHPLNKDYPLFPDYETAKNAMMAGPGLSTGGTEYVPTSLPGRVGMTAASGALLGGAGGAIGGASGGLRAALIEGAKALPGSIGAGAGSQLGVEAAEASGLPTLPMALIGGLAGDRLATGMAQLPLGSKAKNVKPETGELAKMAREEYKIPVTGMDMSDQAFIQKLNAMSNKFPFSPTAKLGREKQDAFNAALNKTMGVKGNRVTHQQINDALDILKPQWDEVAKGQLLKFGPEQGAKLEDAVRTASVNATSGEMAPILRQVRNVMEKVAPDRTMTGDQYLALTRKGTPLDLAMNNPNPNIAFTARQIRDVLDDALEASLPAEKVAQLRDIRTKYKAIKTIEPLTLRSTDPEAIAKVAEGDIVPSSLRARVNQQYKLSARDAPGANPLNDLANIGQRFLKDPRDSGTPLGNMVLNPMSGGWQSLTSRAAVPIMDHTIGRVMRSSPYTERLIQGATVGPRASLPNSNLLVRALLGELAANSAARGLPQGSGQ